MSSPSRRASGVRRRRSAWAASVAVLAVVIPAGAVAADEADVRHEVDGTVVHVIEDSAPADGGDGFGETAEHVLLVDVDGTLVDPAVEIDAELEAGTEVVLTISADAGLTTDEAVEAAAGTEPAAEVVAVEVADDATADLATSDLSGVHQLVVLPVYWRTWDNTSETTLKAAANGTAAYWERQAGSTSVLDVVPSVRAPLSLAGFSADLAKFDSCDSGAIMTAAIQASGLVPSATTHVAVYFPKLATCPFAGRATVTGGAIWLNGAPTVYVLSHELGHNFGLGHANTLHCTSAGVRVPLANPANCLVDEYGDDADVMGQGNWQLTEPGNINVGFAHAMGWAIARPFSAAPVPPVTVDIAPLAAVGTQRGIFFDTGWGTAYVDYRPAVGPDVHVRAWAGVQTHLVRREGSAIVSYLLDMQPSTAPFAAAHLPVGAEWTSPGSGVSVRTVSTGGSGARLSISAGPVQRYVTRVYTDLFGRSPDPTGLAGWTNALLAGTPRIAVANSITYSDEYRSRLIAESYMTYLGRGPDPAGASGWLGAMRAGTTIQQMEAGFIASDEYYARGGGTDAGWVRKLYDHVLGRSASTAEVNAWTAALAQGGSRRQVAMGFLLSTEHLTTVVDGYYQALLGRGIDPAGAQAWVVAIQGGARVEAIIGGIIASDEYYSKA